MRKRSSELIKRLKKVEEGDFTFVEGDFPPVIKGAKGIFVEDVDGNIYRDLTSFFGVSMLGHSPAFVKEEAEKGFFHGMGDLIPAEEKILLLEEMSALLGGGWKGVLVSDGADAVEACLRTALLKRGPGRVIAFEGAYHGTALGALSATWGEKFRGRFKEALPFSTTFFPFEEASLSKIEALSRRERIMAIIIEPIQGRAGIRVAPNSLLQGLRELSYRHGIPLIFDEIYTGFYKTTKPFARDLYRLEPDLIALGKALSASFPLSACMGKGEFMDAWGQSRGEASYTFTFSGNPFFCRVALRTLKEYRRIRAWERAEEIQGWIKEGLAERGIRIKHRGLGVLHGFDFAKEGEGFRAFRWFLERGWITLPSGIKGEVLEIIPPFIIDKEVIDQFLRELSTYLSL